MTGCLNMPINALIKNICEINMLEDATWATNAEVIGCTLFTGVDILSRYKVNMERN